MRVRASPTTIELIHKKRPNLHVDTLPNNEYVIKEAGVDDAQMVSFLKENGLLVEQQESILVLKLPSEGQEKPSEKASPDVKPASSDGVSEAPKNQVFEHPDLAFTMLISTLLKPHIEALEKKIADMLQTVTAHTKNIKELTDRHDLAKTQLEASVANLRNLLTTMKNDQTTANENAKKEMKAELDTFEKILDTVDVNLKKFVAEQETVNNAAKVATQNNLDEHKKMQENIARVIKHLQAIPVSQ